MYANTVGISGFRPEFYLPYPQKPEAPADGSPQGPPAPPGPGISYQPQVHGSHAQFRASAEFARYREEFHALLDGLARFAARDDMPAQDRQRIADGFHSLYRRRFAEGQSYVHDELIDGIGKRSLESLYALVHDESIPLHIRRAEAINLSDSLAVCGPGTIANLVTAQRALLMSAGGIKARLWKMKDLCARNVLTQAAAQMFGRRDDYARVEIHFVNAAWNYLADEIGLEPILDSYAPNLHLECPGFLPACREKVLAALTPGNLASLLAEECLSAFNRHAAPPGQRQVSYDDAVAQSFDAILDNILLDMGLSKERLTLHAFVETDDDAGCYRFRTDATLIAVAVLDMIHAEGLMDDMPVHRGEWRDESGAVEALLAYENLVWRFRFGRAAGAPTWDASAGSPELLRVPQLLRWIDTQPSGAPDVPVLALRAAIRASDPDELMAVPWHWLEDAEIALALLARMGEERARRYVDGRVGGFLYRFPPDQRAAFIDGAMHLGGAVTILASQWYPNMWTLFNETARPGGPTRLQRWVADRNVRAIDAVRVLAEGGWGAATERWGKGYLLYGMLCGDAKRPMLYDAMAADNDVGMAAWARLLCSAAVLPHVRGMLADLLIADRKHGVSALGAAMHRNCAKAVEAYGAMLCHPAILPRIRSRLPTLLSATGHRHAGPRERVNALMFGMDGGGDLAIRAYGRLLLSPALFPLIRKELPRYFGIERGLGRRNARVHKRSPLWWAMHAGRADAIREYRALLTEPRILESLKKWLPALCAAMDPAGQATALHSALEMGHAEAIDEYRHLLAHPAIAPLIQSALPVLALGEGQWGTPGLAVAMRQGHAAAVAAYGRLLVDDAILPAIRRCLPALLTARPMGEASSLAQALAGGHTEAVREFHALLVHPRILPEIIPVLPRLLIAKSLSGMGGLPMAVHDGHSSTILAYRGILADPRIGPHIETAMMRRLAHSRHADAARVLAAVPDTDGAPVRISPWDIKVDQWLTFYINSRLPGPGLAERLARRIRQWTRLIPQ
ncbi:hypothetical protein ACL598_04110 [Bordetella bronchialis]|uniref:hypothetical protein n=1 Tax=Bordetella bronchialis TaxID=463025 RepID=UPI003D07FC80